VRERFMPPLALGLALLVLLCAAALAVIHRSNHSQGEQQRALSATICSSSANAPSCPEVIAVTQVGTTPQQISRFLTNLWATNSKSGSPILGAYELQRCGYPGSSHPYRITCVLWSTGTNQDVQAIREVFVSSRLFTTVTIASS
jgi:hypothetical protein